MFLGWGYVKSLSGRPSTSDTMLYNDTSADNLQNISNVFSQFFAECFNPNDVDVSENRVSGMYPLIWQLSNIECSAEKVYKLISLQDSSSAVGVDGIADAMLKGTSLSVSPILADIFNLSLSSGRIPLAWKISRIIPIYKFDDKKSVKNYRQISLQPIISKILEKLSINTFCLTCRNITYSLRDNLDFYQNRLHRCPFRSFFGPAQ